jgi:hypothetical protein
MNEQQNYIILSNRHGEYINTVTERGEVNTCSKRVNATTYTKNQASDLVKWIGARHYTIEEQTQPE